MRARGMMQAAMPVWQATTSGPYENLLDPQRRPNYFQANSMRWDARRHCAGVMPIRCLKARWNAASD